ncbi:hypothetical protein CPHO_08060 [Corynebacterium phocae]|uniref:Lipoprotein n=1 Tax=Corynebacterium phocae TaxID=161895 RepID=A0A1L7D453_9CORY|nr:hypothetical protein [Corynebacterium phocae]APT92847.1 hypothetical protein CPHO_08060 [Corynebacterium phocae]KAA8723166.1 hypothetical protein F4V58_07565 [Corynebacterium phocae]
MFTKAKLSTAITATALLALPLISCSTDGGQATEETVSKHSPTLQKHTSQVEETSAITSTVTSTAISTTISATTTEPSAAPTPTGKVLQTNSVPMPTKKETQAPAPPANGAAKRTPPAFFAETRELEDKAGATRTVVPARPDNFELVVDGEPLEIPGAQITCAVFPDGSKNFYVFEPEMEQSGNWVFLRSHKDAQQTLTGQIGLGDGRALVTQGGTPRISGNTYSFEGFATNQSGEEEEYVVYVTATCP